MEVYYGRDDFQGLTVRVNFERHGRQDAWASAVFLRGHSDRLRDLNCWTAPFASIAFRQSLSKCHEQLPVFVPRGNDSRDKLIAFNLLPWRGAPLRSFRSGYWINWQLNRAHREEFCERYSESDCIFFDGFNAWNRMSVLNATRVAAQ
jgi:hypothetical protein